MSAPDAPPLAWCETIAANGREHLRRLGPAGLRTSGGTDTMTLCGMHPAWDLASPVTPESLERVREDGCYSFPCTRCVNEARA